MMPLGHTGVKKKLSDSCAAAYLPCHNQTRGSVGNLKDNSSVAGTELADLFKVIILQLSHFLLLSQKGLQAFPLLLIQLELL